MGTADPASREQAGFGVLLKRYRVAAGLSQEALAERARLSVRAIGALEQGLRQAPYRDTVRLLARALGLSPEEVATLEAAVPRRRGPVGAPTQAASQELTPQAQRARPILQATRGAVLPPLVGRAHELSLMERHLAGEGPPLLLLAGEPGIGKSRLLHEAGARGHARGWTVLAGGCQRRGGQEPYAPLVEALERCVQGLTPAQQRQVLQGCAWLGRLLPELGSLLPEVASTTALAPERERRLMFGAVHRLLANAAGPSGTLLLLDDLQWAHSDAFDLLASLVRSGGDLPLRVVGAYRATELHPPDALSAMLADLAQAELVTHLELGPLASPDVAALLDGVLADADVSAATRVQVVERTGGVPFFVLSCARALQAGLRGGGTAESVPWDLAQSIRQRVAALPETARDLLGVAAVVGRMVPRVLLGSVLAKPESELVPALEAVCRERLLEEAGEAGYRFAHDVIREVIERDVGAARRTILHRMTAEALEPTGGEAHPAVLAYHFGRGAVPEKAAHYLRLAGDQALAQYANAAAAGYYRELADRLDGLGRRLEAARAYEKLGVVLRRMARYAEALAALEQAAERARVAGDPEGLARTLAEFGRVHTSTGTPAEGVRRILPVVDLLESHGPSAGLATLYAVLAGLYFAGGKYAEQLRAAERAVELADAEGAAGLLPEAEMYRGYGLALVGRLGEAMPVLEAAGRQAELINDLMSSSRILCMTAIVAVYRGELAASVQLFGRARAVADRLGDPLDVATITCFRGQAAFVAGDWHQARMDYERALDINRTVGISWDAAFPPLFMGMLAMAEGAWDAAASYLEESASIAGSGANLMALRPAQSLLAERDILLGRPDAASARLLPLLDRPGLEELDVTTYVLPTLAQAYLAQGDVSRAGGLAEVAIRRAQPEGIRLALVHALCVQALVLLEQERRAEAALADGLSVARSMPFPHGEGRLLYLQGLWHVQQGQLEPARQRLLEALAIFQRLGARKDLEQTEQLLASLG